MCVWVISRWFAFTLRGAIFHFPVISWQQWSGRRGRDRKAYCRFKPGTATRKVKNDLSEEKFVARPPLDLVTTRNLSGVLWFAGSGPRLPIEVAQAWSLRNAVLWLTDKPCVHELETRPLHLVCLVNTVGWSTCLRDGRGTWTIRFKSFFMLHTYFKAFYFSTNFTKI